ncbi:hypothetical protein [Clostridium gasigenes]|uniref:hypothetical protein n=1 Tax=Clostridium gasigenes TaxID=94869 RepID=UPI001C0AF3C6|nr:hypothetical protein [Clostridium gasigenes]MBU3106629.1 hypothetical protein [Clostridium gasigenes]
MSIAKKKVILPIVILFTLLITQMPSICYASTWKSFTQSYGSSSTAYTNSFNMNGGGMSVIANASGYRGSVSVTLQHYDPSSGWRDYSSQTAKNGSTAIFNGGYVGTWRFKIVYDSTPSSSTATVDYFSAE